MKKILYLSLLLLSCRLTLSAQQEELSITAAAAGTQVVDGIEYTWTLGEIVIEEILLGADVVTQGFHQGNLPFNTPKAGDDGSSVSTIITPGLADGVNDVLYFSELDSLPGSENNEIIIFNRWGQIVFGNDKEPYHNDWKGTDKNGRDLPEGTYYFVLFIPGGQKSAIHGNVLVIR